MDEGGLGDGGLAIDKKDPGAVTALRIRAQENRAEKGSVPRAKVCQGRGRTSGKVFRKPSCPESDLTEERMKTLEIPAAGAGGGVFGRKAIKKFRGETACLQRRTSRKLP